MFFSVSRALLARKVQKVVVPQVIVKPAFDKADKIFGSIICFMTLFTLIEMLDALWKIRWEVYGVKRALEKNRCV